MTLLGLFLLLNVVGGVGLAVYGAGRAQGCRVVRTAVESQLDSEVGRD